MRVRAFRRNPHLTACLSAVLILGVVGLTFPSAGAQSAVAPNVLVVTNTSDLVNGSVQSPAALRKHPGRDGISLPEAMSAANSKTTIEFAPQLATKTITVSTLIFITSGVTVVGAGGAKPGPVIVGPTTIEASNITLRGLDLRSIDPDQVAVNISAYGHRTVQNVTLTQDALAASGTEAHTVVVEADSGGSLKNVTISDNTMTSLPADAIAVFVKGASDPRSPE
jgi:hypothetical protein